MFSETKRELAPSAETGLFAADLHTVEGSLSGNLPPAEEETGLQAQLARLAEHRRATEEADEAARLALEAKRTSGHDPLEELEP